MDKVLERARDMIFNEVRITRTDALELLRIEGPLIYELLALAGRVREMNKGDDVCLCSIINAKSGLCPEDCAFCSQSSYSTSDIEVYPLVNPEDMIMAAHRARENGAREFSIVTSGYRLAENREIEAILRAVNVISSECELECCASMGILDDGILEELKTAGLRRYHHNIETAPEFYPEICTTHPFEDNVRVISTAKSLGLKVCSGGIFGMGESLKNRVEMAFLLKDMDVDSVPINFLNPVDGTRLEGRNLLKPLECLKIIAVYRLVLPGKDIFVCGGREFNLRHLQSWMFMAGANGTMIGNYLTTAGRPPQDDRTMIEDLGMRIKE